ncbi:hypothetical protein CF635_003529 [Enterobacter hormaechei]|nr:hypothetical protein [Enterobacter hormaechei]
MLKKLLLIKKSRVRKFRSAIKLVSEQILETEQELMQLSENQKEHINAWKTYSGLCVGEADYIKLQEFRSGLRNYFDINASMEKNKITVGAKIEEKKVAKHNAQLQLSRGIKEEEKLMYIIEKGLI